MCEFFPQLEDSNVCEELSIESLNQSSEAVETNIAYNVQNDTGQVEFNRMVCSAKAKAVSEVTFLNSYRSIISMVRVNSDWEKFMIRTIIVLQLGWYKP